MNFLKKIFGNKTVGEIIKSADLIEKFEKDHSEWMSEMWPSNGPIIGTILCDSADYYFVGISAGLSKEKTLVIMHQVALDYSNWAAGDEDVINSIMLLSYIDSMETLEVRFRVALLAKFKEYLDPNMWGGVQGGLETLYSLWYDVIQKLKKTLEV